MNGMTNGDDIIRLARVTRVFETEELRTYALADVDMRVERGEFVAVSGPSGCGKSTLLGILGLLDAPTAGSYLLGRREVAGLDAAERARIRNREIGFIFQSFNLIGGLTVLENVELPLTHRSLARAERRRRADEVLERVGMTARRNHYPAQLSGGQQQRVAVARALGGRPALLLADEPTGNLDSRSAAEVMALLDELHAEGATICMVTHDPRFAGRARRTIHLHDGRIAAG
jgi:putative ABC transport system ATP-binding protein